MSHPMFRSNSKIVVVNTLPGAQPEVAFEELHLEQNGKRTKLRTLEDLRGAVTLSNAREALDFVRLKTSLRTWDLWEPRPSEVEVLTEAEVKQLPDYSLRRGFSYGSSGYLGVLSQEAYKAGKFHSARVVPVQGGFEMTRWIYTLDNKVEQVKEAVTTDGVYTRTVLKTLPAPKLPNTYWTFPAIE